MCTRGVRLLPLNSYMVLTERQRADLHAAVLEYLICSGPGFAASAQAFRRDAGLDTEPPPEANKGILEKKWTSIVRLQKRVMELESRTAELEQALKNGPGVGGGGGAVGGVLTFVRDGAGGGADGRLLPRPPAKATMTHHRAPISCIAVHPVYTLAATGSEDSTVKMWDFDTCQYERTLKGHTGHVTGVAFDHAGNLLASCSADMTAKLWDLATNVCIKTLKGHDHTLSAVLFLPSSDSVLTCSRDGTLKSWEVASGYCTRTFSGHSDWVRCMSVSLDGECVASGGSDHSIIVWKLRSGQVAQTLRGHEHVVESVSFGKRPVSATDVVLAAAAASPGKGGAAAAADEGVYNYLASGSRDRSVRLWDAGTGACLLVFAAHENWVRAVLLHPSGKFIISCSDDKSIRVMDIKVGAPRSRLLSLT